MHKEYYCIPDETAKLIMDTKKAGHRVIAVGTTSIRTLESAATAKNEIAGKSGWTGIFIYPATTQDRRRHHHELPPAQVHADHAHQRLRPAATSC